MGGEEKEKGVGRERIDRWERRGGKRKGNGEGRGEGRGGGRRECSGIISDAAQKTIWIARYETQIGYMSGKPPVLSL